MPSSSNCSGSQQIEASETIEQDPTLNPRRSAFDALHNNLSDGLAQNRKRGVAAVESDSVDRNSKRLRSAEDHISYWTQTTKWPTSFFESSRMQRFLARKKSLHSVKDSSSTSETPSDQQSREKKSSAYSRRIYELKLERHGSFMNPSDDIPASQNLQLYKELLKPRQDVPRESLFDDDIFEAYMRALRDRNEARVILDITRLLVPSAELHATRGHIKIPVIESANESWNCSIPVEGPRPQPDFSVGFKLTAFSKQQIERLGPYLGTDSDKSLFMATDSEVLPFLACEVKCGKGALNVADRQNAHSMTLAVRGVVELFRAVGRTEELNGVVVGFSLSHDDSYMRIHSHYAAVKGDETTFHRETIRNFCFTELGGQEKWTSHNFIKNIYENWLPEHFERICSAVDDLPDLTDLSSLPESSSEHLQASEPSQNHPAEDVTPQTSISEASRAKRARSDPALHDG